MSQFKVYGHAPFLGTRTEAIHKAAVEGLGLPASKRSHRFIALEEGYFLAPDDRSSQYLIIECLLFEGRSVATKKAFYRLLLTELQDAVGISAQDIELTLIETPRHDWLIRGKPGDELELPYAVDV
jgi:hypothetical protein